MIARAAFLKMTAIAAVGASTPPVSPSPSPSSSASPDPWTQCDLDSALPYDRPLEMKLRVLDGPDFDLLAYRGKPVLITIFATWCGPCNVEMPYIVEAAADYADRGLVVIGIDSHEPDDTVRAFRKKYNIEFPIAMDETGGLLRAMQVAASQGRPKAYFPATYFITTSGALACEKVGGMSRAELRFRLDAFLGPQKSN